MDIVDSDRGHEAIERGYEVLFFFIFCCFPFYYGLTTQFKIAIPSLSTDCGTVGGVYMSLGPHLLGISGHNQILALPISTFLLYRHPVDRSFRGEKHILVKSQGDNTRSSYALMFEFSDTGLIFLLSTGILVISTTYENGSIFTIKGFYTLI